MRGFTAEGREIADEIVNVMVPVTIGGESLFMGLTAGNASPDVFDPVQTDHGAWTSASKAGGRYTILAEGSPGTDELIWDVAMGRIYSAEAVVVYAHYLSNADIVETGECIEVTHPGLLGETGIEVIGTVRAKRKMVLRWGDIDVRGNAATADTRIYGIVNNTDPDQSALDAGVNFIVEDGESGAGLVTLSADLEVNAWDLIVIAVANGRCLSDFTVRLHERMDRELA